MTLGGLYEGLFQLPLFNQGRKANSQNDLEGEVQKSNVFLQNMIQSTVDGIVVVDTKGNVQIFNEGMSRLTGFTADEIIEKGHLSSFYPIDIARENMTKMRSDRHGPVGKLNPTSMNITTKLLVLRSISNAVPMK